MNWNPNQYPQQQQQQGWQQPQQVVPMQQQQGVWQAQAAPQQQQQQQQQMLPVIADASVVQRAQQELVQRAAARDNSGVKVVEWPGPDGQKSSFSKAPPGFRSPVRVFVLPIAPLAARLPDFYVQEESHFWKSQRAPRGASVTCLGKEKCPVCLARAPLFASGDAAQVEIARKWRKQTKYLYQVLNLSVAPSAHLNAEGKVAPFLMRLGENAHSAIVEKFGLKGPLRFMAWPGMLQGEPHGRPLQVTKMRTGPSEMDVEYSVDDIEGAQIHPAYFTVGPQLSDLRQMVQRDSAADYYQAIQEMGFGMTPEVMSALQTMKAEDDAIAAQQQQARQQPQLQQQAWNPQHQQMAQQMMRR